MKLETRCIHLSYGVRIWTEVSFVLSQFMLRQTDRQTDRQMLMARTRMHSCSAVKMHSGTYSGLPTYFGRFNKRSQRPHMSANEIMTRIWSLYPDTDSGSGLCLCIFALYCLTAYVLYYCNTVGGPGKIEA